ncbi:Uncharacterised protein [Vibrio cholerae]|nr:Uncharacterised protein [Vibrio cholerae]
MGTHYANCNIDTTTCMSTFRDSALSRKFIIG